MGKDNSLTKRKLRKIIEYAITEPTTEEETDPLRTYKYPFISSEVLSAANGSLLDLYFSTEPEEDPEEDLTNAKALKGKKALTVKLQNLVEEEESAPSTEKEPEAKENNNEVKEENKSEPEQETTEKKEVAATQGEEKKEESTPEQEPEKFAREKAILDKCIADLEAECTVEIADSCDNTAMGSDDSCSGNAGKYELVSLLFSFIDVDPGTELNELLAGYFKRAALTLIGGKPKEMAEYFENNASAIQNLFVHATNRSVSEVLCKALSIDETYITNPIRFTQMRNEILHGILTRLEDSGTETYSLDQLAQTFCDLADQSREVPALCCSLDVLRKLFALSLNKHYGIAASAIKILTKLLSMEKSAVVAHLKEQLSTLTVEREAPEHEPLSEGEELLKLIGNQLLAFKEILLEDQDTVENQFRVQIRPFGTHRLKIIEYFHALIKLTIFPIIDQIYRLQYPKLLYELFIRFPFNSVLHSLVYSIYKSVFELDCKSLLHVFVLNGGFLSFLVGTSEDLHYIPKTGQKVRKPFAGYVTKLANHLVALSVNAEIKEYLNENNDWVQYVESTLAFENEKNGAALGGRRATTENQGCEGKESDEAHHLIFEGNLATVFKKLKEITFENLFEVIEEETKPEEKIEEDENLEQQEEETTEETKEKEEEKDIKYLDSQYWKRAEIYTLESIADEFE